MTKENDPYEQESEEYPDSSDFTIILVGKIITIFFVWVINSYDSAQQGYKWLFLGLVILFSGVAVLGTIFGFINYCFKKNNNYRLNKSLQMIFFSLMLSGTGVFRFYESFERLDANNDGLFTIIDISVHAKETFKPVENRRLNNLTL